jgi:hypothetical protein
MQRQAVYQKRRSEQKHIMTIFAGVTPDPPPPPPARPAAYRWVTVAQVGLLTIALGLAGYVAVQTLRPKPAPARVGPRAGRGFNGGRGQAGMGMRGMPRPDRKILKEYDKNGDHRLDTAERAAAREVLQSERLGAFGPRGRPGGLNAAPEPGMHLAPGDVRSYPGAPMYDLATLRTLFLKFENTDWEQELAAFYGTDVDVPATVIADGKTYKDVGIHFRGNSSYRMVPAGLKHSLNLAFDFANPDQRLGSYRTLNLLNANGDPTFVRTVLYSEIARNYVPVPRTNYVRLVINGENWGVYVNEQQFNKDFLRDWFKTENGARWKVPGSPRGHGGLEYLGNDAAPYKALYEIKTKDDPSSWAALINLCRVLNETPSAKLEAAVAPILDIDSTLKFLALDAALVNSDGYWTRASDYGIYLDERGMFHVLPLDFNEAFNAEEGGRRGFGPPGIAAGVDLDPLVGLDDASKPLRSRLLAVPALRQRYAAYVRDIATRWLDWNTVGPRIRQWQALIESDVKADGRKLYSTAAFRAGVGERAEADGAAPESTLRGFIERRRAFLLK